MMRTPSTATRDVKSAEKPVVAMIADYPRDEHAIDGGVQAVTVYLVNAIVKAGFVDLRLVSFDERIKAPKRFVQNGIERWLLPRQRMGAITRWRYDLTRLRDCLRTINPQVVHAQGAGVEGYLAVKSGYPTVVTFHGIIGNDAKYVSSFLAMLRLKMQSLITEDYCARNASHTILISPYVREHYGAKLRGISHLIPNPVDSQFFDLRRSEEPGRVLFAGRMIPRKGVIDLINALPQVLARVNACLVLAGSLSDYRYVRRLKARVNALGLTPYVKFVGLLNEKQIVNEFERATLLVLPSYQETTPMVIQQAMAAGIPVVATRICGIPGQIEDGKSGFLFEPGDVQELARHIENVIVGDSMRESMGATARARALAEYRAERVAEQTLRVYLAALGGHHHVASDPGVSKE